MTKRELPRVLPLLRRNQFRIRNTFRRTVVDRQRFFPRRKTLPIGKDFEKAVTGQ